MAGLIFLLYQAAAPAWNDGELSNEAVLSRAEAAVHEGLQERDDPARARKSFADAADDYEELAERGVHNAHLFRNLGNAYLLAGRLPQAIFAYRRGQVLDPNDAELRADLELARGRVRLPAGNVGRPPAEDWPPWLPRLAPVRLLLLGTGSLALFWISLVRYRMTRHGILLLLGGSLFSAALLLIIGAAVEYHIHHENAEHPLVVIAHDGVPLRKGNGEQYPPRDNVPALVGGMEGKRLGHRADRQGTDWLRIQLAGGEVGWVRGDEVLVDNEWRVP